MRLSKKDAPGLQELITVCRHIRYDKGSGKFYWRYPTQAPFGFYPILGFQELTVSDLKELLRLVILAYEGFKEPAKTLYIGKRARLEMREILEKLKRSGFQG